MKSIPKTTITTTRIIWKKNLFDFVIHQQLDSNLFQCDASNLISMYCTCISNNNQHSMKFFILLLSKLQCDPQGRKQEEYL